MVFNEIVSDFNNAFRQDSVGTHRGIGIECEIPLVDQRGEALDLPAVQAMYAYLEKQGFILERDDFCDQVVAAKKLNPAESNFTYNADIITTDAGFSTLEIVLAPRDNLHTIQSHLSHILELLVRYFEFHNVRLLGYGIQPVTPPSRKLLMPKERYCFFEKFSANRFIPGFQGTDSDLLTITASNQCHIEVSRQDAILATNVLNALSGLQIALHANSPIWQGRIDPRYKANREMFWDYSFPDRLNQSGIPPATETMEAYVHYLLQFKPQLVERNGRFLRILHMKAFEDFLLSEGPVVGETLDGKKIPVYPEKGDLHQLNTFCHFNARLVPKYGTVEARMCCQQPPGETLTSTALTLGIIENLEEATVLMDKLSRKIWRELRKEAAREAFGAHIGNKRILPLLSGLIDLANKGLKKRGLGEELFLDPLYERLRAQKSPADMAIDIFNRQGMDALIDHYTFKVRDCMVSESFDQPQKLALK